MRYVSTRGDAPELDFGEVLLEGLATDGGLYLPESWPQLSELGGALDDPDATYPELAAEVMWPFVEGSMERDELDEMVADAYASFDPPPGSQPDVVPLTDLGDGVAVAELFWGPTFAFKDIALQLVGRLFDHQLAKQNKTVTIVGATSGDTGSAAIDACRDRTNIDIFILHPSGRTSEVQRRQMTTVDAPNVFNVAIEGTFDDCQDIVKALFADDEFRRKEGLSAVNSINWARVMAQIVYYVTSARAVNKRAGRPIDSPVSFSVPTGNFGNIFAGYAAMHMGLPVDQLIVASNTNDILTRFFTTGTMEMREVTPTLSPSMDIQVSSNLERLLFEMSGRNGAEIAEMMMQFRSDRTVSVPLDKLGWLAERFSAASMSDEECLELMGELQRDRGVLVDPHTAVGIGVGRRLRTDPSVPLICLGTAHPAKFPDAVKQATGSTPEPPARLAEVMTMTERYVTLPNDLAAIQTYVSSRGSDS